MFCETSFDSGSQSFSGELGSVISFGQMRKDDKVLIDTANSRYQFAVSDPEKHKGMLSGGVIGEEPREAVLIESIIPSENGDPRDFWGLKRGARVLFYLPANGGFERVTTSKISSLTLVKAADRTSLIS